MRKFTIFLSTIILLLVCNVVQAQTPVQFVYINGSNNNTEKMRDWYLDGVGKLHPVLKTQIEQNEFTHKHMLKNGNYTIEAEPYKYFWGFKSAKDLQCMKTQMEATKSYSSWAAYTTRTIFANSIHDIVWVKKKHNMIPIIQELDNIVEDNLKNGRKIVLLGYSAGTLITFEYLFSRMPYINPADWLKNENIDKNQISMIEKYPRKNTCLAAFSDSKLVHITPTEHVIPNSNKDEFKKAYMDLDKYTRQYCIPPNVIIGVINYANQVPLFYSDITNPKTDRSKLIKLMHNYLVKNDFFLLTVNFSDDPLSVATDSNTYLKENTNDPLPLDRGFIYDYSKMSSGRTFTVSHLSYWSSKKRFSKAIVKGYEEGYKQQLTPDD